MFPHRTQCLAALGCSSLVHFKLLFLGKKVCSKYFKLILIKKQKLVEGGCLSLFYLSPPHASACFLFRKSGKGKHKKKTQNLTEEKGFILPVDLKVKYIL